MIAHQPSDTEDDTWCWWIVALQAVYKHARLSAAAKTILLFKRNRSSASRSAYSYTFLRSVVCLSVVCHIHAPCLNHLTNLDTIWQVHLRGPMTHCVRWGPWPQWKGRDLGSNPHPRRAVANSCCRLANTIENLRGLATSIPSLTTLPWSCTLVHLPL